MRTFQRGIVCALVVAIGTMTVWVAVAYNQSQTVQSETSGGAVGIDQVTNLTISQLAERSTLIAIGKCTAVQSKWVGRVLVTLATVEVSETLKGNVAPRVTVVLPGGQDAKRRFPVAMTYPGGPTITKGEEVFLFLTNSSNTTDGLSIAGYSQGKYTIAASPTGQKLVSRDARSLRLAGGGGPVSGSVTLTPLDEFKREVTKALR